jgi:hypothetical protein
MKNRIFAFSALFVLVLNMGASTFADSKSRSAQASQLVSLLPASDAVITMDASRFFGEALPRVLSANQAMLDKVTAKIDEIKGQTGVDFRQFQDIAVGLNFRSTAPKKFDFDPIVIARGQVDAGALIGAAKLAANGKYREERLGDRTIYIFQAREIAKQHASKAAGQTDPAAVDKAVNKLSSEIAVTVHDQNTLVFGTIPQVKQMLGGKSKIGVDLTGLLGRRPVSVVNFAAKTPKGLGALVPFDNDELGKSINSIRDLYGNMDVAADSATVHVAAQTAAAAQATSLLETLQGLQMVGKAFLGSATTPDKQVYGRMIENARFAASGNEVTLDLQVPQSDIDILIGRMK